MFYVTSDWHGWSVEKIKALLEKINLSKNDTCFILGDVIDRGKYGIELLKFIKDQSNLKLLMGNHEDMMLDCKEMFLNIGNGEVSNNSKNMYKIWKRNGGDSTISSLYKLNEDERKSIFNYLESLPLYYEINIDDKAFILTHAGLGGFSANKKITEYSRKELLWTRPSLYDSYYEDKIVIFGHSPTWMYGEQYKGQVLKTSTWMDVDTGAAGKGCPSIIRLEDMKVFN